MILPCLYLITSLDLKSQEQMKIAFLGRLVQAESSQSNQFIQIPEMQKTLLNQINLSIYEKCRNPLHESIKPLRIKERH